MCFCSISGIFQNINNDVFVFPSRPTFVAIVDAVLWWRCVQVTHTVNFLACSENAPMMCDMSGEIGCPAATVLGIQKAKIAHPEICECQFSAEGHCRFFYNEAFWPFAFDWPFRLMISKYTGHGVLNICIFPIQCENGWHNSKPSNGKKQEIGETFTPKAAKKEGGSVCEGLMRAHQQTLLLLMQSSELDCGRKISRLFFDMYITFPLSSFEGTLKSSLNFYL